MRYLSPLRYPGGKARLAPFFARLISAQESRPTVYAEPFAGGAGAGLHLLVGGHVQKLLINDLNPGIAAFWRAITTRADEFCRLIDATEVSVDAWHEQHGVYAEAQGDDLQLGFATFFLNRTNRSGILSGRPIGGLDQAGAWKIDARWNPEGLKERVRLVASLAESIEVTELDALVFLEGLAEPDRTIAYVDPPYLVQGDRLYFSKYGDDQHEALAEYLTGAAFAWVLTYDAHDRVTTELYSEQTCARFGITYSAQVKQLGKEFMVFSPGLVVPDLQVTRMNSAELVI